MLAAQAQVLVAEGRGDVDDAAAVVHADEIGGDDAGRVAIGVLQGGLAVVAPDEPADGNAVLVSVVEGTVG